MSDTPFTPPQVGKTNPAHGGLVRQGFDSSEVQVLHETASEAVAAREKAAVQARYLMAIHKPRNVEQARQELLDACKKKEFAEAAWFDLTAHSRGEGFTIRFAEEALRAWGNVYPESRVVYESDDIRIISVTVTDLQANLPYTSDIVVKKTIERSSLRSGESAISERVNSKGKKVFLVEATEDEVTSRVNNMKSRAIRTDGLRLIPAWLKVEAQGTIFATLQGAVEKDIPGEKRKIIDAFADVGVKVPALEDYLGYAIERMTVKDIVQLRQLWVALGNNHVTWEDALELRKEARRREEDENPGSKEAAQRVAEEKLRKQAAESGQASSTTTEATPEPEKQTTNRGFDFGKGGKK